jgi:hypothetical protein
LQVITLELLNLINKQTDSGNKAPGDEEALPPAIPEFACILPLRNFVSIRGANWQNGIESQLRVASRRTLAREAKTASRGRGSAVVSMGRFSDG